MTTNTVPDIVITANRPKYPLSPMATAMFHMMVRTHAMASNDPGGGGEFDQLESDEGRCRVPETVADEIVIIAEREAKKPTVVEALGFIADAGQLLADLAATQTKKDEIAAAIATINNFLQGGASTESARLAIKFILQFAVETGVTKLSIVGRVTPLTSVIALISQYLLLTGFSAIEFYYGEGKFGTVYDWGADLILEWLGS